MSRQRLRESSDDRAERIARESGCTFTHTCTFSYQAPGFYQRLGYEVFAVLDDYPDGIRQFFLKKRLSVDHPATAPANR